MATETTSELDVEGAVIVRRAGVVWCSARRRAGQAHLLERRLPDGIVRWIQWCSLRGIGPCPEHCQDQLREPQTDVESD